MARIRSPLRDKAFEIYKENNGNIKTKDIAKLLNIDSRQISTWKSLDKWDIKLGFKRNKPGGQKGNNNAKGNKGGSGTKGNLNALKHGNYCDASKFLDKGFLAKYIPTATKKIIKGVIDEGVSTLDIMWDNIILLYISIIRAQKIMYVKNQNDLTKELKRSKVKNKNRATEKTNSSESEEEYEYELQFAWDKQERFIKTQSIAMKNLNSMIKDYEELLNKNWNMASEEQRIRIEVLKSKLNNNDSSKQGENIMIVDDIDD